jgi:predicted anti-sigma-YlaC factor YlaD
MNGVFDRGCERAQEWASLELDGELSQLERALLATHLRRCAACAEAVGGMRALTSALRAAPLEPLDAPAFVVTAEKRRSRPLAVRLALAATLAVVAAGLGMFAGTLGNTSPTPPANTTPDLAFNVGPDEKRDVQGLRPNKRESRDEVGFGSPELLGGV